MPSQVTNYKCPNCTGPLHFVGASGNLECDYCGGSFTVQQVENMMAQAEAKAEQAFQEAQASIGYDAGQDGSSWDNSGIDSWGAEGENLKVYSCPSCGAELICDETTAATSCPYCNNPTIVPGQFSGALKPDLVIPFKLDKDAAVANLKKHYKGKPFLPNAFTENNHVEDIKGVYVPFWLYDGVAEASAVYDATRSHTHREGNYQVTTTEHYRVMRSGSLSFENVPVDASSKMPDDHMDSIEPYDYAEMRPFSTAYLPGYLADKYDVTSEESAERADLRCENSVLESLRNTVSGYEFVSIMDHDVQLHRGKVRYALMPVWMLNTKYQDKNFLFAMNGQTGKMVGDLPVSKAKMWGTFAAIAAPLAALLLWLFSH